MSSDRTKQMSVDDYIYIYILHIPQSSKTEALPSDCLVSYLGHLEEVLPLCREAVGVFYPPTDWAKLYGNNSVIFMRTLST